MNCVRCRGLMVPDHFLDLYDDMSQFNFHGWRCVNCGAIVDPIILGHRARVPSPLKSTRRWARHAMA